MYKVVGNRPPTHLVIVTDDSPPPPPPCLSIQPRSTSVQVSSTVCFKFVSAKIDFIKWGAKRVRTQPTDHDINVRVFLHLFTCGVFRVVYQDLVFGN